MSKPSSSSSPATIPGIEIRRAGEADVAGIHRLMTANLAANGGCLSASFSPEQIVAMLQTAPMLVAHRETEVVGFLMTGSRAASGEVPVLRAMLEAYPGAEDAYVYGPVCVAADVRGQGLAQTMFAELRRHLPGREGILFVRRDNAASLRAHAKMGMREVAEFSFRDAGHVVFAYRG
ncbi:GNAT family N-acetyltransferase [Uliginosibacterium sp. 31-16]|uniref:GNAT family N-acetyltransferase n=1 Tax=Uliginosibacterium sp. 31-16 TaxID=3068315 RepID=UPI00273E65B8|nr:GNAT family N-acetyltransferase [Uliginosibacterium sp. 31-16]MDP5238766.1 GNAT family N-acetyltransferase [Uliginosibacterium sp. 31-16]